MKLLAPVSLVMPLVVAIAGIIIVRAVFEWRILDRKKERHDEDDSG